MFMCKTSIIFIYIFNIASQYFKIVGALKEKRIFKHTYCKNYMFHTILLEPFFFPPIFETQVTVYIFIV